MPGKKREPKEATAQVRLRLPKSRLAELDKICATLDVERSDFFDHLLNQAPVALDCHKLAEDLGALQFQLWQIQRLGAAGRLDRDLAQELIKCIDGVAQQITRQLRLGE